MNLPVFAWNYCPDLLQLMQCVLYQVPRLLKLWKEERACTGNGECVCVCMCLVWCVISKVVQRD